MSTQRPQAGAIRASQAQFGSAGSQSQPGTAPPPSQAPSNSQAQPGVFQQVPSSKITPQPWGASGTQTASPSKHSQISAPSASMKQSQAPAPGSRWQPGVIRHRSGARFQQSGAASATQRRTSSQTAGQI
jgi:hypothetical protein